MNNIVGALRIAAAVCADLNATALTLTPMVSTSNHEEQTPASNNHDKSACDIYALGAGLHFNHAHQSSDRF